MEFKKYQHVERLGTTEVDGIELGDVWVFPKLDGSNGSVWLGDDGKIKVGSRNRELTLDNDHAGFCAYIQKNERIHALLKEFPYWTLYGEWLIPHSLKTYVEDAWRKFYVFDILFQPPETGEEQYVPFEGYQGALDLYEIEYVMPICKMTNPTYENLLTSLEKNTFLIRDGEGFGEGIVIKNYSYRNKYGRTTWAKLVTNEFKEKNKKEFGVPNILTKGIIEQKIADIYCTEYLIEKEYEKITIEYDGWNSKCIGELLGRVYYELIREESWNFIKELKYPTINFKILNTMVVQKIKQTKPELF